MINPFTWYDHWRQRRELARHPLPLRAWHEAIDGIHCLQGLSAVELAHLRERVVQFLHRKTLNGVQGLALTRQMRLQIAAQACLPILHLDMDYYDGWHEVVVYPDSFRVHHTVSDDIGLVSEQDVLLSGEAWGQGPVILAWADIARELAHPRPGANVVIHEFAHKLDMLNGRANGMPPLHPDMPIEDWTHALSAAYRQLQHRIERHHRGCINPYGATSPAEFFAVLSEYFFTAPWQLQHDCPDVYGQLKAFYRQDPLARLPHNERHTV